MLLVHMAGFSHFKKKYGKLFKGREETGIKHIITKNVMIRSKGLVKIFFIHSLPFLFPNEI